MDSVSMIGVSLLEAGFIFVKVVGDSNFPKLQRIIVDIIFVPSYSIDFATILSCEIYMNLNSMLFCYDLSLSLRIYVRAIASESISLIFSILQITHVSV